MRPLHSALPQPARLAELCGHRGASARARENTAEAFELAIALGADRIEFDVRRTRDGVLVLHHDPRLNLGRRWRGPWIAQWTYAELKRVDPELMTLAQLVELAAGRIKLDMELKEAGYEAAALELVVARLAPAEFVVTSFRDQAVAQVKRLRPDVAAGLLVGDYWWRRWLLRRPAELVWPLLRRRLARCRADFIAPSLQLANWGLADRLIGQNWPAVIWTVDDPEVVAYYRAHPAVGAVISNLPG